MYEYVSDYTCNLKFNVMLNRDGNILQDGETPASQKNFSFGGFTSTITAAETVNDDDDEREEKALHNGVSGLMWLFSGIDENFDTLSVKKTSTEMIDSE